MLPIDFKATNISLIPQFLTLISMFITPLLTLIMLGCVCKVTIYSFWFNIVPTSAILTVATCSYTSIYVFKVFIWICYENTVTMNFFVLS
jgi:hypothetical protein